MQALDSWFLQALERIRNNSNNSSMQEELLLRSFYFYQKSLCGNKECFADDWSDKYLSYIQSNFQQRNQ